MKHMIALVLGAALAASVVLVNGPELAVVSSAQAAPPVLGNPGAIPDVAEKATPSVVSVSSTRVVATSESPFGSDPFEEFFGGSRGRERRGQGLGSGVIVSSKGYVLTNNHVVANAKDIKVILASGREATAEVVGTDPKSDLAVLKLKGKVSGLKPIAIGDSDKLRLGEVVLAIGNPFGVGQTVTMGIVSAKGKANLGIVDYEDFIQTDAAINPGNSGGALVNLKGELVGINTAILSRTGGYQGIGLAIPTNMARPIMNSLISTGKVVRGWLGVSIQDVTAELKDTLGLGADRGVIIGGVVKGSPAEKAGLRPGDVVLRVNGRDTPKAINLRNEVASAGVGKAVAVDLLRGGKRQTVQVVLSETPADPQLASQEGSQSGPAGSNSPLGVAVAPLSRATRERYRIGSDVSHGVVVTGVSRGSVGESIQLQPGDVILQVNRTAIKSPKQLDQAYRAAGRKLALLIQRGGGTVYVVVKK
jgi:serine protease Do